MTDIETALAEALEAAEYEPGCADCGATVEYHAECPEGDGLLVWPTELVPAILATEPMQAIARQAAIGAAVEGLPKGATIHRDHADGWWQVITFPPNGRAKWCPTLPEAIAAALEDDR